MRMFCGRSDVETRNPAEGILEPRPCADRSLPGGVHCNRLGFQFLKPPFLATAHSFLRFAPAAKRVRPWLTFFWCRGDNRTIRKSRGTRFGRGIALCRYV